MERKVAFVLLFCVLGLGLALLPPPADAHPQHSNTSTNTTVCNFDNPGWREPQIVAGVQIEEDRSCSPDNPNVVAAVTKGTNNVPKKVLKGTGLSNDAVTKCCDKDGDNDPDVINVTLEIVGLNEAGEESLDYEIAPGIKPAFWTFAPKTRGMATEGSAASDLLRMPAPVLRVEEDDTINLKIENTHYLPHTLHLHGVDHPFLDSKGRGNDGVPQTSEQPIMPGESRVYTAKPRTHGTMFYHCHVQPDVHVLMGLQGMFVVEDNLGDNKVQTLNIGAGKVRHPSEDIKEKYDGEFDLQYQGVDKELHNIPKKYNDPRRVAKQTNRVYDVTERDPDYFLLNGKSFPYTVRESQIIVEKNERYRLRILNGGSRTISIHTHGHKFRVEELDGTELPEDAKYYRDVIGLTAAQRADITLNTTDDGQRSYGPGVWFMHDHREEGVTNDGMSPGGTVTMITYESFIKKNGIPHTPEGVSLSKFFDRGYYNRTTPVWDSPTLGEPSGSGAPEAGVEKSNGGSGMLILVVFLVTALIGGLAGGGTVYVINKKLDSESLPTEEDEE